jgi:hypothetical protein
MSVGADSFDQVLVSNAEEREFLQYVHKVAAEKIALRAEEFDQTGESPEANIEMLNSLGFNGVFGAKEAGCPARSGL